MSFYKRNSRILRTSNNIIRSKNLTTSCKQAMNIMESNNYEKCNETAYDIIAITDGNNAIKLNTIKKISFTRRDCK